MLKIKDNVDLKELEKFGFKYTNEHEQIYLLKEDIDSTVDDCVLIHERNITLRVDNNLVPLFMDYDLTILYDLIHARISRKSLGGNMKEDIKILGEFLTINEDWKCIECGFNCNREKQALENLLKAYKENELVIEEMAQSIYLLLNVDFKSAEDVIKRFRNKVRGA